MISLVACHTQKPRSAWSKKRRKKSFFWNLKGKKKSSESKDNENYNDEDWSEFAGIKDVKWEIEWKIVLSINCLWLECIQGGNNEVKLQAMQKIGKKNLGISQTLNTNLTPPSLVWRNNIQNNGECQSRFDAYVALLLITAKISSTFLLFSEHLLRQCPNKARRQTAKKNNKKTLSKIIKPRTFYQLPERLPQLESFRLSCCAKEARADVSIELLWGITGMKPET